MRIAILSIAFLLLAFAAQSQVLKSAGVWYFLDVDSMTARPAVLPNGTELAYVVGTKKIYYWHRGTSTWTEYGSGSTFSRDSIYFDSSIVGSGTVSDPWGVDSTLFATISGVGDSIAAAVANYFPLQGGTLTGTGGNGFVGFPLQSSPPSTPSTGFSLFAGSTGNNISWMQPDGFFRRLVSPVTGTPRQYQFMARSYTLGDSADIANNVTSIAANYLATSNGTNLVARNLFDNNTYVGVLNSKPFSLGQWTTAGRPTGTNGYAGFNTSFNWLDIYSSSGWFSPLQSSLTVGLGTAGRVLYTDANGRATDNANLLFTGTRFQTAGSIRIGNSSHTDTVSIEKVTDTNSKVLRINNPGSSGAFNSGLVFRGGSGGTLASVNTFRIAVRSTTRPGAVYIGNVTEANSANSEATTSLGILNKVTSLGTFDAALNLHPATGLGGYSLAAGKQYGIFIGGETSTIFTNFSVANTFGIFLGYQYQPTAAGYAGSFVVSAKNDGGTNRELARFQGKDGNLCLGCTNATYNIYTDNTGAFGIPSGTVAQRPTFSTSHPYLRFNTDSTQLEYAEAGGTIRQIASRAYARSLVSGLPTTNIYTANGSLTSNRILTGGSFNLTFNAKTKIGLDSSFVHDPAQDTTYLKGNVRVQSGNLTIEKASGTPYLNIVGKSTGNQEAGIYMESRGNFGSIFEINGQSVSQLVFYNYQRAASAGNNFTIGENNGRTGATAYGDFIVVDSTSNSSTANRRFRFDSRGEAQFYNYGTEATTAAAQAKTQSVYAAGFATDGTITSLEIKRDTTIYVTDADYNFSAAITSANILKRYNNIVIYSKLTSGSTSDNQIILHSASSDFLQCEIIIYSNDASADADATSIDFTTNGAVDGAGGTVSSYGMSAGQRVNIRAVDDGGYKWFFN